MVKIDLSRHEVISLLSLFMIFDERIDREVIVDKLLEAKRKLDEGEKDSE